MKYIHIPTHWTPEQATMIHDFLVQWQVAVWESYQQEIDQVHNARVRQYIEKEHEADWQDEILF